MLKILNLKKNSRNQLVPCLSLADIKEFGIKTAEYPELQTAGSHCVNLAAIPDATSNFEFDSQRLYLSIPQIALDRNPRGYVDLANIDNGINALLLNYSYNGSKNYDRKKKWLR
ncbi:F1 capsule-anchoring protein precursor [Providencia rettgeri]|uniref:F1 capsule-anchoring protein n=1 Tax=Providencia rettgeri TaxID=587 RepID=A0A379FL01_PRORE|nr:F1 capsule-anchoring protein precursor [Providencia rettgeri]